MQLTNGNLFWPQNANIEKKYEYLSSNINVDVLVIGAGISGAITSYYLAKEGLQIATVDKNIIGYGSTAASTALLEYQVDIDMFELNKIIGENYSNKIYNLCKEAVKDIENIAKEIKENTEFERKYVMYYTNKIIDKNAMIQEFETRKDAKFNVQYVEDNDLLNIKSGIKTIDSSAIINPYLFTQKVFKYLSKEKKIKIYENTQIDEIVCMEDQVILTTNNNFKITAKYVIMTSGFETVKYLENSNYKLYKTFTIVTSKIKELENIDINFTGRDKNNPYHYIRFNKENRIIYGGEDILLTPKYEKTENLMKTAENKYKKLENSLKKLLKYDLDFRVEYAFNGTFATTKDTLPIIDELHNMPNCYCNLGFGSNGVLYSTIGAKLLSNYIVGKDSKALSMFRVNRD